MLLDVSVHPGPNTVHTFISITIYTLRKLADPHRARPQKHPLLLSENNLARYLLDKPYNVTPNQCILLIKTWFDLFIVISLYHPCINLQFSTENFAK